MPEGVLVRWRTDEDVEACAGIVRATYTLDGYPVFVRDGDFAGFVAYPDVLEAWVAECDGEIVGHVALHRTAGPEVTALAATRLGVAASRLGIVARLVVAPRVRRRGVARALLVVAVAEAHNRGLEPVLDVVTHHVAAVTLYETAGWVRLGEVRFALPDGRTVAELVYRAPPPPPQGAHRS